MGILLVSLPCLLGAQEPCGFDRMRQLRLEGDGAFRERQELIEQSLLREVARRLNSEDSVSFRGENEEVYAIPVVFHLFFPSGAAEGSAGRPSAAQVRQALARLNDAYRRRGEYASGPYFSNAGIKGTDTGIEFQLAQSDPSGAASTGIRSIATAIAGRSIDSPVAKTTVLDSLRRLSGWPADRYLNIYVLPSLCDQAGKCPSGFSYPAAAHGRDYDGVYVTSQVIQSQPEVLAHEVGHYLNLLHTFEGSCDETDCLTGGDRVCDTPPDCTPYGCGGTVPDCLQEERQNSCHNDALIAHSPFGADVEDMYENFMDYGAWICYNSFTPGQRRRMRDALTMFRSSLLPPNPQVMADTCSVRSVALAATDSCYRPPDSAWAEVLIDFVYPPSKGELIVNGRSFPVGSSPQRVRISRRPGPSPADVNVFFSAAPACRLQKAGLLPAPALCPPTRLERCQAAPVVAVSRSASCDPRLMRRLPYPERHAPLPDWPAACAPYAGGEWWVKIAVPETGEVTISARPASAGVAPAITAFTGCTRRIAGCASPPATGTANALTLRKQKPGDTLSVAIWFPAGPTVTEMEICVYLATPPPPNDDCGGAGKIAVSDSRFGPNCTASIPVDWTGALNSGLPSPCADPAGPDVWFYVLAPEAGRLTLQLLGNGAAEAAMAVYPACEGKALACARLSDKGKPETRFDNLRPGEMLLVRLWPKTKTLPSDVRICAVIPPVIPSNDLCSQALPLPVSASGSCRNPLLVGNITPASSGISTGCVAGARELWYRLSVPAQGAVIIEANVGAGLASPGLAVFSACGGKEIACLQPGGSRAVLPLEGLTPGDILLIALWDNNNFLFGSLELCAYIPPPPANDNCSQALILSPAVEDSTLAPRKLTKLRQATPSGGWNSAPGPAPAELWYRLPVNASGRLVLELVASGGSSEGGVAVLSGCGKKALYQTTAGRRRLIVDRQKAGDTLLLAVWSTLDSASLRAFVVAPCALLSLSVQTPDCNGESSGRLSVSGTAGHEGYFFRWNNGSRNNTLTGMPAGLYQVTVTGPYECRDTLQSKLNEPPLLQVVTEAIPEKEEGTGGKLVITARGGSPPYDFSLDGGKPGPKSVFEGLIPGLHHFTVTDARGCTWSDTIHIDRFLTAGETVPLAESIRLFPNPVTHHLLTEIVLPQPLALTLEIRDSQGRTVTRQQPPPALRQVTEWETETLAPGVYYFVVGVPGRQSTRRFVVVEK